MKKNKFFSFILFLTTALLLWGCAEENDETTIYIPEAGVVVNTKFLIKDDPYVQGFRVAVTTEKYPRPSVTGLSSDITVHLETDVTKVESYNAENGTSYKLLPEAAYSFDKEAVIKAGSFYSDSLKLYIDAKNKIEAFEYYLLPISIKSVDGGSPDVCHQTVYFLIYATYDASDMVFLNRSKWKVVSFSTEEANGEGPNNGRAIYAFDGKGDTFWHTQWQGSEPRPPHFITVDMGEVVKMSGFSHLTRDFGGAWPKECTIEVSKDGNSWETAATFKDLPASGATEFRSFFPKAKDARYFKMNITSVYGGSSTHVAEINAF